MNINVDEYLAIEGCEFSYADAKHDFHTIFKSQDIEGYVKKNIPDYPSLQCNSLTEDDFVDKYALVLGSDGSSGLKQNKENKEFIKSHLNPNIQQRYEAFYIERPQHSITDAEMKKSLLQECFRKAGLLDDIFFICDVAYANVREDLKFADLNESQTFYWVQNAQTLYDPAGKTSWHSDKSYFENESVDENGQVISSSSSSSTSSSSIDKIPAPNHFKKDESKFVFCWQNARKSKITQYPKWSKEMFPNESIPYKFSNNIPELMLYTNKDLFLGIRANKENLDDYALHEAYLIITDPDKHGYYGYADKNLAAKGSGILTASELASYRAKGDDLKKFVKFINNNITGVDTSANLFLDEVMNYSPIFQVLAKKVGDASQSISCCQKKINLQKFKKNSSGPKDLNNIVDFESNGNHAFVSFDRIAIYSALNFNAPIVIGNTQEGFTVFIQKELLNIHKQLNILFAKSNDDYQILNQLKTSNATGNFFTFNESLLSEIVSNKVLVKDAIISACLNLNIIPKDDITYQLFLINYFNESNVLQIFSNISPDILNFEVVDYNRKIVKIYNDNLKKIKENNKFQIDFSDLIEVIDSQSIEIIMPNINNNVNKIIDKINENYNIVLGANKGDKTKEDYTESYKYIDNPELHKNYVNILEVLKNVEKMINELSEYQKFLILNNNSMIKIKEYQSLIKLTTDLRTLNEENNRTNVGLLPKGIAKNITGYTPFSYYLSNDRPIRNSDVFFERSTSIFGTTTSILQIFNILNSESLSKLKDRFIQTVYNMLEEISVKATANNSITFVSVINTSKELLKNQSIVNPLIEIKDINADNISEFLPILGAQASQEIVPDSIQDIIPEIEDETSSNTVAVQEESSEIRKILRDKKLLISGRSSIDFKSRVEKIRNPKATIESLFETIATGTISPSDNPDLIKIAYENDIFIKGFIGIFAFMQYIAITSDIDPPSIFTTRTRTAGDQAKVLERLFGLLYLNLNDNKEDPNLLESIRQLKESIQKELPGFNFTDYEELKTIKAKQNYIKSLDSLKSKSDRERIANDFNQYISYCQKIDESLDLYEVIDEESINPPDSKSDFSLYSFKKLLEMNVVTISDNNPLTGKFEGINSNEINANMALLYFIENRMAKKNNIPVPHPELIGLFSQLFKESGLNPREYMGGNKKLIGGGDDLFDVMNDLFISDEDISGEDIEIPEAIKKYYRYKNKKITLFDIYRINSYLLLNMPTNLEIANKNFSFYPEEIRVYLMDLNRQFEREQQRKFQMANLGNLAKGTPGQGRPYYEGPGFQEKDYLPPAIGVRGGKTKKYNKNKTKINKTKKRKSKICKNKSKKHKINKNKITKKHK